MEDRAEVEVRHRGLLMAAVLSAMIMQVLDATIANVALPRMQSSLGANQDEISWVLTSYMVCTAVMLPASGWLTSRFGARRVFITSVSLFIAASMLCGTATSLPEIVLFRMLQGLGGALIAPLAQSTLFDINPPSQQARAMSWFGIGVMVGPISGPMLGGWLTENFNWRWVFLINLPVGLACLTGLWLLMPERPRRPRQFDLPGWTLIGAALASSQLLLDRGHQIDWFDSPEAWVEATVFVCALWMFAVHQATAERPLFPREVLKNANMMLATGVMFCLGVLLFAVSGLLPGFFQHLMGFPVMISGELLAVRGTGVVLSTPLAGWLVTRVDPRLVAATGIGIMIFSLNMMSGWTLEMTGPQQIMASVVQGFGMGFVFVPLNLLAFATLDPKLRTDGASLFNLARNMGASIGIAVVTVLLARNTQVSHSDMVAKVTTERLGMDPGQFGQLGDAATSALMTLDAMVYREAAMIAYLDDFWLLKACSLAALPLVLLLKPPRRAGTRSSGR